jgi:hypothetical protein
MMPWSTAQVSKGVFGGWLGGQVLSCKSAALHTSVHLLPLAACFL